MTHQEKLDRLQKQVDAIKKRSHPPEVERLDETRGMRNVVEISDCIDDIIPILNEKAKVWTDFVEKVKEQSEGEVRYCDDHPDVRLEIDLDKTLSATWFNFEKEFIPHFKPCLECQAVFDRALVNERKRKMGIPLKTIHAAFSNFVFVTEKTERVLNRTKSFIKMGRGFIIFRGLPGTGKTHLASAILNHIGDGIFVTEADLVAEYRQTYTDNALDKEEIVEKYRRAKVLVLDELSADVKGVDIAQLLYRILAHRFDVGLLTVITSNETLEAILDILGARLADRIKECYYVGTFDWESYRGKHVASA